MCLLLVAGTAQAADMTVLRYLDQDAGDPSYVTRILVTADFLRMDGGEDGGDFILLDRRTRRVFNVLHDARMTMQFVPGKLPDRPQPWKARLAAQPGAAGTLRYRLSVGEALCSEGSVAPRAAPDAARALGELKGVLAATQYRVWRDTPREMQHDCDLANLVWDAGAVPGLGLPLEEREFSGKTRRIESQASEPVRPELFHVPDGYAVVHAPS
jgi:hypothetical protein